MNKLQAIRYFLRVVEAGSFSAAARQLEVSPPAVTKLVAALEYRRKLLEQDRDRFEFREELVGVAVVTVGGHE